MIDSSSINDAAADGGAEAVAKKARRGILWLLSSSTVWQLLSWVFTLLTARFLHPTDYGLLALAETMNPYLLLLATLKLDTWLIQQQALGMREEQSVFSLALLLGAVACLGGVVGAPVVGNFYDSPQVVIPLQLVSTVFFLRSIQLIPDARLRRAMEFKTIAAMNLFSGITRGALQLGLAAAGFSFWSLVIGNLYGEVVNTVWLSARGGLPRGVSWESRCIRSAFLFGVTATTSSILWVLFSTADNIVVGKLFGVEALGYYAFAFSLTELPLTKVNAVISPLLVPLYSALKGSAAQLQRAFLNTTQGLLFFVVPGLVALCALSPRAVPHFFGQQWLPLIPPLQALCFAGILRSLTAHVSPLLFSLNKPGVFLRVTALTAVTLPVAFYLLGSNFGLPGIYGAWFFIYPLVGTLPLLALLRRELALSPFVFARTITPPLIAGAGMGAALWLLERFLPTIPPTTPLLSLLAAALTALLSYAAILLTLFRTQLVQALTLRPPPEF